MSVLKNGIKSSALIIFFMGILLASGVISNANAAVVSCDADISKPGMSPTIKGTPSVTNDDYSLWVQCSWWTAPRQMFFHPDLAESGYATALTAISLDRQVSVKLESGNWYSLITDISILAAQ